MVIPLDRARRVAAEVTDPELPILTLADLGVLRDVSSDEHGRVVVTITPTYSGCPAMATIRADLRRALARAGFDDAQIRTALSPAWSTDWISDDGRRKLADYGIAPPGPSHSGPVLLTLTPRRQGVHCPRCGSVDTEKTSEFAATPCKSLHRCRSCAEPFERVKEI
ncbi:1,2-phenylacetyl-CoA epoxidase subunit PaaD [Mycobacterium kyorinense]|uniref:1,2-phenylacetyl-CoA epoxidase subunit PaaD n=1 Tax=Mycobacterium kyorinense TaxID=487514 RepID=UPI000A4BD593|nr:1,2-phenylacetyl-CoA epoxidase subunit PaaD [Mycobacterium kyorinense]